MVSRGERYSMKGAEMPSGMMRWFGTNFTASALGVDSVWMKIVRAPRGSAPGSAGFRVARRGRDALVRGAVRGRVWIWRAASADALAGDAAVTTLGLLARRFIADLGAVREAMISVCCVGFVVWYVGLELFGFELLTPSELERY